MKKYIISAFAISSLLVFNNCKKNDIKNCIDIPIVGFSLSDDVSLGAQTAAQIDADAAQFPLVDSVSKPTAYRILYKIRNKILNSGKVKHKDDFPWRLRIINDPNTQNAFCTPGGFIYVYTGLIKVLDNESQLAGVMGHEMGHADLRHSVTTIMNENGVGLLLSIATGGNPGALTTMANQLRGLKNSRCHEIQADESSVLYLAATDYPCNSAGAFFEKIVASGAQTPPEILSTHPDPGNRVENINKKAGDVGCSTNRTPTNDEYTLLKRELGVL
ncbi:MAG: peptidase M48 [Cytophagales bacterium]|nr:MAG: peptidase M48 [Cytophagales bacterium]